MIIRPIAASMPWMAAAGKMALRRATFNLARITCNTPAMAMATRTRGYPTASISDFEAPPPRRMAPSVTMPANRAGASPAAGPLMVTYEPPRNGRTKPAMIADVIPQIGGAPEVIAIPIENGIEIMATAKPERRS